MLCTLSLLSVSNIRVIYNTVVILSTRDRLS